MRYEDAYSEFLQSHMTRRGGERKGRLARGHHYAEQRFLEQVWWPAVHGFEDLHPEYEISDWNRKSIFLDFAYITPLCRIGIECDGYQSHVKDMDRERFSYALNRDTFLTGMGWRVLHFSVDDIEQRPELCRMLLKLALSPCLLQPAKEENRAEKLHPVEQAIIRLAWSLGSVVRLIDVKESLSVGDKTGRRWLQLLCEKGLLAPMYAGKAARVCRYELNSSAIERMLA